MLRKHPEEPVNQHPQPGNRIKLPEESGIRSVSGFKEFLALAESSKGNQIELSWTTKIPGQRFVLDMQWDANQKAPFWTLYEENNGKSKRIWDEPFTLANVDMCYDVLVMTCGAVDPTTKNLAEILKAQPEKMDWTKPANKQASSQAAAGSDGSAVIPGVGVTPGAGVNLAAANVSPGPAGINTMPNNGFPPNANQNAGFPPGYVFPPAMGMPINGNMGFPMPPYNTQTNPAMLPQGQMPDPVYLPSGNSANPGFPPPQGMPPNAWQYGANNGASFYGQPNMSNLAMPNASMQNMPMQNVNASMQSTLAANLSAQGLDAPAVDSALFKSKMEFRWSIC